MDTRNEIKDAITFAASVVNVLGRVNMAMPIGPQLQFPIQRLQWALDGLKTAEAMADGQDALREIGG